MKQVILKRAGGVVALAALLFISVSVFGQENSSSSEFTSPAFEPELFVVPLLDPDVAVVNPSSGTVSTSTTQSSFSGGELQKIETSVDAWTKELEQLDVEIMKIQRGGASANIVAEKDELVGNNDDKKEEDEKNKEREERKKREDEKNKEREEKEKKERLKKEMESEKKKARANLKSLKDDRKTLIKDIKKAGELAESNLKEGKEYEVEEIL